MYKKFLNGFLAVALVVAGTMFTSCQDYDEDIKDLREQISQTATDLTSLINEKINTVENEISNLQSQLNSLQSAYEQSLVDLYAAIEKAKEDAKAYADDAAAAAEQAAKDYADIQAAQAEAAAIAAAQAMIEEAVATLQAQLDEVNATLADHATSIAALIAADAALQEAIDKAAALAQEAYNLAETAYNLALQNQTDITTLKGVVDALGTSVENLESQVSILNDAVEELYKEAAANAAAILALETELNELKESNEAAHEALQGQIDDLADLIAENQAAVEQALADLEAEMAQVVEELYAALDALDASLKEEIAAALASAEEYTDAAVEALYYVVQAYVDAAIDELTEYIEGKFDDIDTDIQTLYALANQIQIDLSALTSTVDDLSSRVDDLEAALADLNQFFVLGDRLTSLVFAPTTYVDGIASICFSHVTFSYYAWEAADGVYTQIQDGIYTIDIADDGHVEEYLYSPSHVAVASVASLDFVSNTATNISTKSVSDESPLTISDYSFANGVLSVTIELTGTLPTDEENSNVDTFTTVALKAGIADEYKLDSEAEQDIFVYSDWARVYDVVSTNVNPYIHNALEVTSGVLDEEEADSHFFGYSEIYTTGTETSPTEYADMDDFCVYEAPFDESFDLNTLVTVCDKEGTEYSVDEYPFSFEFSLVDYYCVNDGSDETETPADQADYAAIDEIGVISAYGTAYGYRDAIGKYPVVQVILRDTTQKDATTGENAIVDVRYFAILWTASVLEDVTVDLDQYLTDNAVYLHYRKIWGKYLNPQETVSVDYADAVEEVFNAAGFGYDTTASDWSLEDAVANFWSYYSTEYVLSYTYVDENGDTQTGVTHTDSADDEWWYRQGNAWKVCEEYTETAVEDETQDPFVTFGVTNATYTQHTYSGNYYEYPEVTCYDEEGNVTATYPADTYEAAKYVETITIQSLDTTVYPNIVISVTVYVTDDCEEFVLNPLYQIEDPTVYGLESDDLAVLCKGQLDESGAWIMYTNVNEHFKDGSIFAQVDAGVDNVEGLVFDWAQAYETAEGASMVDPAYNDGEGGLITEEDSNVGLQESLADSLYVTNMVYSQVLHNGEYCPHDYYIVFVNPFLSGVGVASGELDDKAGENVCETAEQVVIYDTYGEVVLAWDETNEALALTDYAATQYGLTSFEISYAADEENGDWKYLQEQIANLTDVELTVDEATGEVTWMNEGTRLQGEYTIYVVATVDFGVATATCTVTVILNPTGVAPATLPLNVL
ncbi:MAG: hypothetical protein LUD72_08785 [Bacteroidales bacterium]|nr:hypothetical protein [Bacteroidales bacterium]